MTAVTVLLFNRCSFPYDAKSAAHPALGPRSLERRFLCNGASPGVDGNQAGVAAQFPHRSCIIHRSEDDVVRPQNLSEKNKNKVSLSEDTRSRPGKRMKQAYWKQLKHFLRSGCCSKRQPAMQKTLDEFCDWYTDFPICCSTPHWLQATQDSRMTIFGFSGSAAVVSCRMRHSYGPVMKS